MDDQAARRRFDEEAREWDTPDRVSRAAALAAVIREHVPLGRDQRLIDIGAGTGLLGLALAGDVERVVLAEPSDGMLAVTRDKLATGAWPGARAVSFDLGAPTPVPGAPFDVAVSLLVLHHVGATDRALRAIADLLAPGGWIALIDLDAEDGSFHADDAEGVHHQGFDRERLRGLARDAGFVDVATRTAHELERDGRRYPLFLLTGRIDRNEGPPG